MSGADIPDNARILDAPSHRLAAFALELEHDAVPAEVRRRAVLLVLDNLGAGIHGRSTRVGQIVLREASERYRSGSSAVWGTKVRLQAAGAALANATASHAFELDDYSPPAKTHPGTVIVPTALAVAPTNTSGRELITSIIAAYDVMVRVSLGINAPSARGRGFHMTGLAGPFGATAVAARLEGLNVAQFVSAVGIAASSSSGIFAFSAEGAMTKSFHAGRAAEAGIVAVRLARAGFIGPTAGLDAPDGGLLRAVSDRSDVGQLTEELGERFEIARVATKPYPCCGSNHSSIDAVLALRGVEQLTSSDIDRIEAHNAAGVIMQCGFDYGGAGGPLEAQMSLQYCLAIALVDGSVGLRQFESDRRTAPEVLDLARRVTFVVDPQIDAIYPREFPGRVRIFLKDGRVLERYIPSPLGAPGNSLTEQQVIAKFLDVTSGLMTERRSNQVIDAVLNLDSLKRVGDLNKQLARIGM